MTIDEIKARVDAIRAIGVDNGEKYRLYQDVLAAIANGARPAKELAYEALAVDEIEVER